MCLCKKSIHNTGQLKSQKIKNIYIKLGTVQKTVSTHALKNTQLPSTTALMYVCTAKNIMLFQNHTSSV